MNTKSVSDKKVRANRRNSQKSTGPDNTSSTRLNAVKHGLLAAGVTELDNQQGYRDTFRRLGEDYLNEVQTFLLARVALYMIRLQRTARLEAEFITSVLHPTVYGKSPLDALLTEELPSADRPLLDPGLPPSLDSKAVETLVTSYQRYESSNENKFYRALNQLERIGLIRRGEHLPAPLAVDVTVNSESSATDLHGSVSDIPAENSYLEAGHKVETACPSDGATDKTGEEHTPLTSDSMRLMEEADERRSGSDFSTKDDKNQ